MYEIHGTNRSRMRTYVQPNLSRSGQQSAWLDNSHLASLLTY